MTNHEGNSLESIGMPTILNRDPFLCFWLLEDNENARNWYSCEPFFCQSTDLAVIPEKSHRDEGPWLYPPEKTTFRGPKAVH